MTDTYQCVKSHGATLDAFYHPFAHLPTPFADLPNTEGGDW
jgi:hypothetical protein